VAAGYLPQEGIGEKLFDSSKFHRKSGEELYKTDRSGARMA